MSIYLWSSEPSKIYVWSSEVKEVYVGTEKVRPNKYEYSYDFRGKSSSEIWNEFTKLVGTIASNSNWFYGNGGWCIIWKNIPSLGNASKITISWIVVGTSSSYTATQIWIGKWTSWGNGNASYSLYWSKYNWCKVCYYDWTDHNWNVVWNATWNTYNITLIIDLVQKTITGIVPWFSNSTLSLTDVQINNIRTFEYLRCYVSSNNSTLSYINIIIE